MNRLGGKPSLASLDLDEHERIAIAGDQVDLAAPRAIVSRDDSQAASAKVCRRRALAPIVHMAAAARAKGMNDAQYGELIAIIGLAGKTNHLVTAMQIPADPEFLVTG